MAPLLAANITLAYPVSFGFVLRKLLHKGCGYKPLMKSLKSNESMTFMKTEFYQGTGKSDVRMQEDGVLGIKQREQV
jgi:hypothetical protein